MTAAAPERVVEALYDQARHHDGITCTDDDRPATAAITHGACMTPVCARHAAGAARWLARRASNGDTVECTRCQTHNLNPAEIEVLPI